MPCIPGTEPNSAGGGLGLSELGTAINWVFSYQNWVFSHPILGWRSKVIGASLRPGNATEEKGDSNEARQDARPRRNCGSGLDGVPGRLLRDGGIDRPLPSEYLAMPGRIDIPSGDGHQSAARNGNEIGAVRAGIQSRSHLHDVDQRRQN